MPIRWKKYPCNTKHSINNIFIYNIIFYIVIFHNHICTDVPKTYTITYTIIINYIHNFKRCYIIPNRHVMCDYTSAICTSVDHGLKMSRY